MSKRNNESVDDTSLLSSFRKASLLCKYPSKPLLIYLKDHKYLLGLRKEALKSSQLSLLFIIPTQSTAKNTIYIPKTLQS